MKHTIHILLTVAMLSMTTIKSFAYIQNQTPQIEDSITISLLTCSPGNEVYTMYGHTAIRYTDKSNGTDIAVNYGIFSFKQPYFILRFIFGLTDYEMGIIPFDLFCNEYESEGRTVTEQVLNLTAEEKVAITQAIERNYMPENRVYRYNYFYDNCTTRARDILLNNLNGSIQYTENQDVYPSFRSLTHKFNEESPWARFGNDLLLGVKSDRSTNRSEYQFLPLNLEDDFNKATITDKNGEKRQLIKDTFIVVNAQKQKAEKGFPLRPSTCAWVILIITVCVTGSELIAKKTFWGFDLSLMIIIGTMGILPFIMLFSQLPTTNTNLQTIILNPLPLIFAYHTASKAHKKKKCSFWLYASITIILFFIAGFFQHYAEGMYILALSLLMRCICRLAYQKKYDK